MTKITLTDNAIKVLQERYFIKNGDGEVVEDWEQLCRRVAKAVAADEKTKELKKEWEKLYFHLIYNKFFIPNTPTLMNAGKKNGQLAACFVLPVEDDLVKIMKTATDAALIHKSGGGTGFDFSRLRPSGSRVCTTSGAASGPVSFMKMYNDITEQIKQGGTRRGANMGILRVDHPDILKFIDCKQDITQLTNFNISVAITDNFMKAVEEEKKYELIWEGKVYDKIDAKKVFDKICKNAWNTGEPGIFFVDTANKTNGYGEIRATNPCGEQPLRDNEACTLGSMNLGEYVNSDGSFAAEEYFDHIKIATRFLDSVVSVNQYPVKEIEETHKETRKIGLGVMGLADMFIKMGIVYGSEKSFKHAKWVYDRLSLYSKIASGELGVEKGDCKACLETETKQRNYWTNTNAPTGTISIIAGCSSGIEPIYAIGFYRNVLDGKGFQEFNTLFTETCKKYGFELTPELKEKICSSLSIQGMKEIPEGIRELFVTAADATPEQHVKMQAVIQKSCDSGYLKLLI